MRKFLQTLGKQTVWIVLLILIGIGAALDTTFLSSTNIFNVLRQATALGFVSIGQTFAVIADCVDLSVGALISLVQCVAAYTMDGDASNILPALIYVVLIVLVVGFANGFAVANRKGNPFIVTLGTMVAIQGLVLLYTNEQPGGSAPDSFRWLADGYIGPVPFPVIVVGIFFVLGQFVLRRTTLGRYSLAVGGNEEVARLSGIQTIRIKYAAFLISAAGAAITGLFLTARMNIGDPLVGTPFSLDSIAAVVIGGTSISGGRGSIVGTLGGVLLYSTLNNLMNILNVSPFYQITVKGLIIVLAISIYEVRRRSGK